MKNKFRFFNIVFYILFAYQIVLLILGSMQYYSLQASAGFCLVSVVLIQMYIFMNYAKGVCIAWNEFCIRLLLGKLYTYDAERQYHRGKRNILICVIIASFLAVISTIANILAAQKHLTSYQPIFGLFGISALLMLILTIVLGIKIIIWHFKKQGANNEKGYLLFKTLILQNFLIALALFNTVLDTQA